MHNTKVPASKFKDKKINWIHLDNVFFLNTKMIQKKNHNIHKVAAKTLSTVLYPDHYNKLNKCDNHTVW